VLGSPGDIVTMDDEVAKNATVLNPNGECVQGQFATLFINEDGAHGVCDIFPLVQDLYHHMEEMK
jgi:hypothetical protein